MTFELPNSPVQLLRPWPSGAKGSGRVPVVTRKHVILPVPRATTRCSSLYHRASRAARLTRKQHGRVGVSQAYKESHCWKLARKSRPSTCERKRWLGAARVRVISSGSSTGSSPLLSYRIVRFLTDEGVESEEASSSSGRNSHVDQCRIEAAHIIASLAHGELCNTANAAYLSLSHFFPAPGPRDAVLGLLEANVPNLLLQCLSRPEHINASANPVRAAIARALRAVYVAVADCAGPALWGLGDDCKEFCSEIRATLDCMFQVGYLSIFLHFSS